MCVNETLKSKGCISDLHTDSLDQPLSPQPTSINPQANPSARHKLLTRHQDGERERARRLRVVERKGGKKKADSEVF